MFIYRKTTRTNGEQLQSGRFHAINYAKLPSFRARPSKALILGELNQDGAKGEARIGGEKPAGQGKDHVTTHHADARLRRRHGALGPKDGGIASIESQRRAEKSQVFFFLLWTAGMQ